MREKKYPLVPRTNSLNIMTNQRLGAITNQDKLLEGTKANTCPSKDDTSNKVVSKIRRQYLPKKTWTRLSIPLRVPPERGRETPRQSPKGITIPEASLLSAR
uniref:Uncharacterized protein n=1 Tax=Oryza sativa subsp. japonica TaxID=39947 RepID=Q6H4Q1_ORYSJ|nr:hypothetical protein [Oryza sativa Japonica Group]